MKRTGVTFVNNRLKKAFEELKEGKFEDKEVYQFIQRAKEDLKEDPTCGTRIPNKLIPKSYVQKYAISNLWKYNLPNAWRLIYTTEADEVMLLAIILEWMDHKNYERRFGYKKK